MKTAIFGLICAVLVFGGCSDDGNVATVRRYANEVRAGGDGVLNVWLWYVDVFNEPITQPGLRLGTEHEDVVWYRQHPSSPDTYWDCPGIRLLGPSMTGEGGRLRISGFIAGGCEGHPQTWPHTCSNTWFGPTMNGEGTTRLNRVVDFAMYGGVPWYMRPDNANPNWTRTPPTRPTAMGNLTEEEQLAIDATTVSAIDAMEMAFCSSDPNFVYLPVNGIEWTCQLIQQNGSGGSGYSLNVEPGYSPVDTDDWEENMRFQSPLMYSFIVETAEPIDLSERVFSAKVKSNALPEGIDVSLRHVAQNEDKTVHVLHTDYFLAVSAGTYSTLESETREPEIFDRWSEVSEQDAWMYDPNNFPDPNIPPFTLDTVLPDFMDRHDPNRMKPLHYIPLEDIDELRVQFIPDAECVSMIGPEWLGSNKCFDIDNNGIVNLKDTSFGF